MRDGKPGTRDYAREYDKACDNFLSAINSGDREQIKKCMSLTSLEVQQDSVDDQIDSILSVFTSKTVLHKKKGSLYSGYSRDGNKLSCEVAGRFVLVCGEKPFHVELTLVYRDDFNSKNEGIKFISISGAELSASVCNEDKDVSYAGSGYKKGIYFEEIECRHDFNHTLREVSNHIYLYREKDRTIFAEEMKLFVKEAASLSEVIEKYGEPNCSWDNCYFYWGLNEPDRYIWISADRYSGEISYAAVVTDIKAIETIRN